MEYLKEEDSKGPTHKGSAFEVVCACLLRQWSGSTVFAFLDEVFGCKDMSIPSWTKSARLIIEAAGNCEELGFSGDSRVIDQMFSSKTSGLLLRPDKAMRPDWGSWLSWDDVYFWGLFCSTKLLGSKLTGPKTEADIRSTDPNTFYHKKDGSEVNPKAKSSWDAYSKMMNEKKIVGNLRLHVVLPETKRAAGIYVEGNDILAIINWENFGKFCKYPDVVRIVGELCKQTLDGIKN